MNKLNEITTNLKQHQQTDPTIKKLSDEIGTIKTLIEKQTTTDDILSKLNEINQKQKAPLEAPLKDQIQPMKNEDLSKKVSPELINTLKKLDDQFDKQQQTNKLLNDIHNQLTHLNNNLPSMNDIPKQLGQKISF